MTTADWILSKVDTLLLWLIAPSLIGAFFGDSLRKDVLTLRQRAATFLAMSLLGSIGGVAAAREWHLSDYTGAFLAILISTLGTDAIGLVVAVLRQFREDPAGWLIKLKDVLMALLPWRKP